MVLLSDQAFRDLLDWYMCSDPWPMDQASHDRITAVLDEQAKEHDFSTWVEAYHNFKLASSTALNPGMEPVKPKTIERMLALYPDGFSVGPGGAINRTLMATSHFVAIAQAYPVAPDNGGYLVVESVED